MLIAVILIISFVLLFLAIYANSQKHTINENTRPSPRRNQRLDVYDEDKMVRVEPPKNAVFSSDRPKPQKATNTKSNVKFTKWESEEDLVEYLDNKGKEIDRLYSVVQEYKNEYSIPDDKIRCPKCSSTQLSANKKGFSGAKAVGGALIAGPLGVAAGTIGSNKVKITCLKCGHVFKPGRGR